MIKDREQSATGSRALKPLRVVSKDIPPFYRVRRPERLNTRPAPA